jgi:hypothetical protein
MSHERHARERERGGCDKTHRRFTDVQPTSHSYALRTHGPEQQRVARCAHEKRHAVAHNRRHRAAARRPLREARNHDFTCLAITKCAAIGTQSGRASVSSTTRTLCATGPTNKYETDGRTRRTPAPLTLHAAVAQLGIHAGDSALCRAGTSRRKEQQQAHGPPAPPLQCRLTHFGQLAAAASNSEAQSRSTLRGARVAGPWCATLDLSGQSFVTFNATLVVTFNE